MSTNTPRGRLALLAAAALAGAAIVLLILLLAASSRHTSGVAREGAGAFAGAALPGVVLAPAFTLADDAGRRFSLANVRGQVTVLAFLSTTCAPACVLVAQQIRGALDELSRGPQVLFVSADPAADTHARVARFLAQVGLTGRVRYLTGSARALQPVWRAYGVHPVSSGRAAFERALEVRLIDRRGRERVLFGIEQLTPEGLAHDLRELGTR
jgi:protein SCO1